MNEIKECDSSVLGDQQAKSFKYFCVYKSSNNGSLSRDSIFKIIGSYLNSKNKAIRVDFDSADYVVVISVICSICFISFVKNYDKFKKFNLIEMGAKFNKELAKLNPNNNNNNNSDKKGHEVKEPSQLEAEKEIAEKVAPAAEVNDYNKEKNISDEITSQKEQVV